jgi:hypothetical protein
MDPFKKNSFQLKWSMHCNLTSELPGSFCLDNCGVIQLTQKQITN